MTYPNLSSCKQFNSMRIMHIKRTIGIWSDKFKDLFFKNANRFHSITVDGKKISKVFMINNK